MTKLLEEIVAKVSVLSEDEQDAVAIHVLEGMAAVKEDAPVPEWHKRILHERRANRKAGKAQLLTLDEFRVEVARQRAVQS